MLITIFSLPFLLGIYWLLWRLYLWAAPSLVTDDAPDYIRKPAYWQFALVLLVITFVTTRNSK